jgi:hypothetical protein
MNESREKLAKAYKRAGIGLGVTALLWLSAFLFARNAEFDLRNWAIPIGAAALSVLCFSLYAKAKEE